MVLRPRGAGAIGPGRLLDAGRGGIGGAHGSLGLGAPHHQSPAPELEEGLPLDGNLINVKLLGAVGDGVTDDTAAINAAILTLPIYGTSANLLTKIIYFPPGEYLVSDTVQRVSGVSHLANTIFIGAGKDATKIKLKDNCAGYGSAGTMKPVVAMHSGNIHGQSPSPTTGEGNEAFGNSIQEMTIDCGSGNPGAAAVDYLCNNVGCIRNVRFTTQTAAHTGISMVRRYEGPSLISNVEVDGPFLQGIDLSRSGYSATLEHVTITGATAFGMRTRQNVPCIRDLTITMNGGVGFAALDGTGTEITTPWGPNMGLVVWIDGVITGTGTAAFEMPNGHVNLKNVNVVDFVIGGTPTNAALEGIYRLGVLIDQPSWELEIKETPVHTFTPATQWEKITAPVSPTDGTAAINAGLAAATGPVVYLPTAVYRITAPLQVPDHIERIEGLYSYLELAWGAPQYVFEMTPGRTGDFYLQKTYVLNTVGMFGAVYWDVPGRLIVKDYAGATVLRRNPAGGEVFGENINCTHLYSEGGAAGIWVRQLNPEVNTLKCHNTDSPLWVLGYKTEQISVQFENVGGNIELVGGLHWPGGLAAVPMWTNTNNGRMSLAYVHDILSPNFGWTQEMTSTINGVSNTILTASFYQRGLFNGRTVAKLCTDDFIPTILFTPPGGMFSSSVVGTTVATATLSTDYAYSGTPVWSLVDNAGGKYAINASTGEVTVAAALAEGTDNIIITVSGLTFGASGTPVITPKPAAIVITDVWGPEFLLPNTWWEVRDGAFQNVAGTTPATANGEPVGLLAGLDLDSLSISAVGDDTTRPTLQGVGAFPYALFDGVNDLLRTLESTGLYAAGACTVVLACRTVAAPASTARYIGESGTGNNPWYTMIARDGSVAANASAMLRNDASTGILGGTTTPGLDNACAVGTDVVLTFVDDGSTISMQVDKGTPETIGYTRSGTLTLARLCIGGILRATAGNWVNMRYYGSVTVPRVLDPADQTLLIEYAALELQGRAI